MGVDMGEGHLQPADKLNKRGYYEDVRFQAISKELAGRGYSTNEPDAMTPEQTERLRNLIKQRNEECEIWGFKGPRTAWTLHLFLPHLIELCDEVRIVVVRRRWDDVVDSMQRHSQVAYGGQLAMTREEADTLLCDWDGSIADRLHEAEELRIPVHKVFFERLLDDTLNQIEILHDFALERMIYLSNGVEEAATWIDPAMNHFDDTPTIVIPTLDPDKALKTADLARERAGCECRVIIQHDEDGLGFTATVNEAIEGVPGYIALLNDDCIPSQGWLATLIEEIEKRAKLNVWFAGPSGPCRTHPQNSGRKGDHRRPRSVKHVAGFCLVARPGAFDALDGLDPDFTHYASEVDAQWRARRDHGAKSLWVPSVYVDHELHPPLSEWWARDQTILHNKWR
jgi:hypothetical protein